MDAFLDETEKRGYVAWVHSPSVHSSDPVETILAYKMSKLLDLPGSRVLKALRRRPGVDPEIVRRVEDFVRNDSTLAFADEGETRRLHLIE